MDVIQFGKNAIHVALEAEVVEDGILAVLLAQPDANISLQDEVRTICLFSMCIYVYIVLYSSCLFLKPSMDLSLPFAWSKNKHMYVVGSHRDTHGVIDARRERTLRIDCCDVAKATGIPSYDGR